MGLILAVLESPRELYTKSRYAAFTLNQLNLNFWEWSPGNQYFLELFRLSQSGTKVENH